MNNVQWYRGVASCLTAPTYVNVGKLPPNGVAIADSQSRDVLFYLNHFLMIEDCIVY